MSLSPSCNWRAEVCVDVMRPALPAPPALENTVRWQGMEKFGRLSELNISVRNWAPARSVMRNRLFTYGGRDGSQLRFVKPRVVPTIELIYSRAAGFSTPTADRNGVKLGAQKKASADVESMRFGAVKNPKRLLCSRLA